MNVRTSLFLLVSVCVFAATSESQAQSVTSTRLTTLADVHARLRKNDTTDYTVDLTASVNFWDRSWKSLFVQDGETAVFVQLPEQDYPRIYDLGLGDVLRIQGSFNPTRYVIFANSVERTSVGQPATAMDFAIDKEKLGSYWSRRVKASGTVETVLIGFGRMQLIVRKGARRFFVRSRVRPGFDAPTSGTEVAITGTLSYLTDENDNAYVALIHQMPADQLDFHNPKSAGAPAETVSDFSRLQRAGEDDSGSIAEDLRYEVHGQITYIYPYQFVILENGEGQSLVVYAPFEDDLHIGDVVRVIGTRPSIEEPGYEERNPLRPGHDFLGHGTHLISERVVVATTAPVTPPQRYTTSQIIERRCDYVRAEIRGSLTSVRQVNEDWEITIGRAPHNVTCVIANDVFEPSKLNLSRAEEVEAAGVVFPPNESDGDYRLRVDGMGNIRVTRETAGIDRTVASLVLAGLLCIILGGIAIFRIQMRRKERALVRLASRLGSSYEAVSEGLLMIDRRGAVVAASPRLLELLGLDSKRLQDASGSLDAVGQVLACRFQGDQFADFWSRTHAQPAIVEQAEFETVDEVPRILIANTTPVFDTFGRVDARIWAFDDITTQKQLEVSLLQAQKMDAVGQLVGGVAHDFNNMLTVIGANLELVRINQQRFVREVLSYVDDADRAVELASGLTDDLLSFSHRSELALKQCELDDVIQQMCALLERSLRSEIDLRIDLAPDVHSCLLDKNHIIQALLNICLNARDALLPKGGTIFISVTNTSSPEMRSLPLSMEIDQSSPETQFVKIRVLDSGEGVPPAMQTKIFEPFYTTKAPGKGTGLGLAISKRIIQRHGGDLIYRPEVTTGACFDLFLPAFRETEPT